MSALATTGFTQPLLTTLQSTRQAFDAYLTTQKNEISSLTTTGFGDIANKEAQLKALLARLGEVKDVAGENANGNRKAQAEEEEKRRALKRFEEEVFAGGPGNEGKLLRESFGPID